MLFGGWGDGVVDVRFALSENVNPINPDHFARDNANPLLLAAALNPSALVDAIMLQVKRLSEPPCSPCVPAEREQAIADCEKRLDSIGYTIEHETRQAIERGENPARFVDADPKHTLLVRVHVNNKVSNEVPREAAE
jgi:hypothetical protein